MHKPPVITIMLIENIDGEIYVQTGSSFFVIVSKVSSTSHLDHKTSGRPFASFFLQAAAKIVATESSIFLLLAIVADPGAPIALPPLVGAVYTHV